MHVEVQTTLATDEAFLVPRESFLRFFDQLDFRCREVINVESEYDEAWFTFEADNPVGFLLPTIQFVSTRTQFINGRHRTAVLLPHMADLPIAFSATNPIPQNFREHLRCRQLPAGISIQLPWLPIVCHYDPRKLIR